MGVIAEGILRGCQGLFTPVSLGYPLSVFNKNSTLSRTTVLQSQSDVCRTTDKDMPLTPIFFVCLLASDKFVCLASKQGFS